MKIPTGPILILVVVGLLVLEILALVDSVPGNNISQVVWRAVVGRPFIPFLVGFLFGHFFWQEKK